MHFNFPYFVGLVVLFGGCWVLARWLDEKVKRDAERVRREQRAEMDRRFGPRRE